MRYQLSPSRGALSRLRVVPALCGVVALQLFLVGLLACGAVGAGEQPAGTAGPVESPDGGSAEGGGDLDSKDSAPAPETITVRTPGRTVQWAAYKNGVGGWTTLGVAPSGIYSFPSSGPSWGVAFACDYGGGFLSGSRVTILYRTSATKDFSVSLDLCPPGHETDTQITATISNVPESTMWLYGSPGFVGTELFQRDGTTVTLSAAEPVGIKDFAFGISENRGPVTRMALKRGESISGPATAIAADLMGPESFVPETRSVTVHGLHIDANERQTLGGWVMYATDKESARGLPLSPQDYNPGPDVTFGYAVVPAPHRLPSDRYTADLGASWSEGTPKHRMTWSIQTASDIDVSLSAAPAAPLVTSLSGQDGDAGERGLHHVHLKTEFASVPLVETYEIETRWSYMGRFSWLVSMDKAYAGEGATITDETPDFTKLAGWDKKWSLCPDDGCGDTRIGVIEPRAPLGDGTMQRSASGWPTKNP